MNLTLKQVNAGLADMRMSEARWDRLRAFAREYLGVEDEPETVGYDPLVLNHRLWLPVWMLDDPEWYAEGEYETLDPRDLLEASTYHLVQRSGTEWVADEETGENHQIAVEEAVEIRSFKKTRGMIGFSRGNLTLLRQYFGHLQWDDRRSEQPMPYRVRFISDIEDETERQAATEARPPEYAYSGDRFITPATLRPDQMAVVRKAVEMGGNVIKADTGWGKTISSEYIICELGQRALILVEEIQCGRGWLEEFYRHTNIAHLEEQAGCELIGIYGKTGKKGHVWPCITIATYQSFIRNDVIAKNRNTWGTLWVDEVDRSAARCFSQVVNTTNSLYRGGCTATTVRNDGLQGLVFDIIGPVIAHGKEKMLNCNIHFVQTGVNVPRFKGSTWWTKSISHLVGTEKKEGDQTYFELVRKLIIKLVEKGRNILVVCDRNAFLKRLQQALDPRERPDLPDVFYEPELVRLLIGDSDRDSVIRSARANETRVVLGQAKLLKRAINVPSWDAGILVTPMSGWSGQTRKLPMKDRIPNPELVQLVGRIRRRQEGKSTPWLFDMVAGGDNYLLENTAVGRRNAYEAMGFRVKKSIGAYDLAPELNQRKKSAWDV